MANDLAQWQLEALEELLAVKGSKEVAPGQYYIHSPQIFGTARYHMVTTDSFALDVTIDQIDKNEKYQQRIVLETDEIAPLLLILLFHWLERKRPRTETETEADYDPFDYDPF